MAIYKEIKNINGVTTTYHRIDHIEYNLKEDSIHIKILNYVDKEIRDLELKIKEAKEEASKIMTILNDSSYDINPGQTDMYIAKLERLGKILDKDMDGTFYVDFNEIYLEGIKDCYSINSIYKRLSEFQDYSGCKEV